MKNLVVFFTMLFTTAAQAQTVTGYWYGQANVEVAGIQNNYLTELIIAQKGSKVKGFFGYYFKDVYQSFIVKGTYDRATRKVVIPNIPIIFYQTNSTQNSVDCITSFYGTLRVSKVKTELTGHFYRDKKYKYTCPDLRVNYTLYTEAKVEDSIFKDMASTRSFWKPQPPPVALVKGKEAESEAEMSAVPDAANDSGSDGKISGAGTEARSATGGAAKTGSRDSKEPADATAASGTKKPVRDSGASTGKDSQQTTGAGEASKPGSRDSASGTAATPEGNANRGVADNQASPGAAPAASAAAGSAADHPGATDAPGEKQTATTPPAVEQKPSMPQDIVKINNDYKKRKLVLGKLIDVGSDSVRLSFYDNAEIDGDSISVFLNGNLVVAHQELSERAFNVYVKLDSTKDINEVSMFAENLGKYPPNTALMVISDGEKRYETFLSSDFKGNATIRLRHRRNGIAGAAQ